MNGSSLIQEFSKRVVDCCYAYLHFASDFVDYLASASLTASQEDNDRLFDSVFSCSVSTSEGPFLNEQWTDFRLYEMT